MKTEGLIRLIENPDKLDKSKLNDLLNLVDKYPYFQTAHMACLKTLHNIDKEKFQKQLKLSSVFISNREKLYRLLFEETQEIISKPSKTAEPVIEKAPIEEKTTKLEPEEKTISSEQKQANTQAESKPTEIKTELKVEETKPTENPVEEKAPLKEDAKEIKNDTSAEKEELSATDTKSRKKEELEKIIAARMAEISTPKEETSENTEAEVQQTENIELTSEKEETKEAVTPLETAETAPEKTESEEKTEQVDSDEDSEIIMELADDSEDNFEVVSDDSSVEIISENEMAQLEDDGELLDFMDEEETETANKIQEAPDSVAPISAQKTETEEETVQEEKTEEESPNGLMDNSTTGIPGTSGWFNQLEDTEQVKSDELSELAASLNQMQEEKVPESEATAEAIPEEKLVPEEKIEPETGSVDLIDSFIKSEPKIERPTPPKPTEESSVKDVSQDGAKEDENLISDTLAKIYIMQGYYDKAIVAYEKLSLKYPEKSTYFGGQIEKIKKLTNKK